MRRSSRAEKLQKRIPATLVRIWAHVEEMKRRESGNQ